MMLPLRKRNGENRRYLWADVIRIVAIFLVVFVHNLFFLPKNTVGTLWMWIPYLYAQMGVPLFVMISGALLLGKDDSLIFFFQKRIRSVLLPWLGWVILYIVIDFVFHHVHPASFHDWIRVFYEMFFSRFWFLPVIFGLYLLTPILKILVKNAPRGLLPYSLLLWYFAFALLPGVYKIFGIYLSLDSSLLRQVMEYSGLFVLGFLLTRMRIFQAPIRFWVILFVISMAATYLGVFLDSFTLVESQTDPFYYRIFSPTMVPGFIAFFMILFHLSGRWEKTCKKSTRAFLAEMSQAALGIYLVHEIVQEYIVSVVPGVDQFFYTLYPFLAVPLRTVLIFLCSFAIIVIVRRLPIVKLFV